MQFGLHGSHQTLVRSTCGEWFHTTTFGHAQLHPQKPNAEMPLRFVADVLQTRVRLAIAPNSTNQNVHRHRYRGRCRRWSLPSCITALPSLVVFLAKICWQLHWVLLLQSTLHYAAHSVSKYLHASQNSNSIH